jgi:hypothetical protein
MMHPSSLFLHSVQYEPLQPAVVFTLRRDGPGGAVRAQVAGHARPQDVMAPGVGAGDDDDTPQPMEAASLGRAWATGGANADADAAGEREREADAGEAAMSEEEAAEGDEAAGVSKRALSWSD